MVLAELDCQTAFPNTTITYNYKFVFQNHALSKVLFLLEEENNLQKIKFGFPKMVTNPLEIYLIELFQFFEQKTQMLKTLDSFEGIKQWDMGKGAALQT